MLYRDEEDEKPPVLQVGWGVQTAWRIKHYYPEMCRESDRMENKFKADILYIK